MENPISTQEFFLPMPGDNFDWYRDTLVTWALVDNPQTREDFQRELAEMERRAERRTP